LKTAPLAKLKGQVFGKPTKVTGRTPMALSLWEILNRSKDGPIVEEKQYDLALFKKTQALQKKHGIKYDPAKPVDVDGGMADRVYLAGVELFLDLGT
jgi:methylamine--corrinoid protein Co-methyltransferase